MREDVVFYLCLAFSWTLVYVYSYIWNLDGYTGLNFDTWMLQFVSLYFVDGILVILMVRMFLSLYLNFVVH